MNDEKHEEGMRSEERDGGEHMSGSSQVASSCEQCECRQVSNSEKKHEDSNLGKSYFNRSFFFDLRHLCVRH